MVATGTGSSGRRFLLKVRTVGRARIVALVLAAIWASVLGAQTAAQPRVIEVIADKDNTFKVPGERKPVITLKAGEKVVLRITSHFGGEKARDDAVHSLVVKDLRDQGWDIRLYEGTKDYTLVAPAKPGEYVIECTVKCGPGHDDMKMKLIVQ
jgi:heme/copper-type cytochrome/quinol oxidase subunit 2